MSTLFKKHQAILEQAIQATVERGDWAAFAEIPSEKIYGEGSKKAGEEAFAALQNQPFTMAVPMQGAEFVSGEKRSPYGFEHVPVFVLRCSIVWQINHF